MAYIKIVEYFRSKINLILRDLDNYKDEELGRELVRLGKTAYPNVLLENEFAPHSTASEELVVLNKLVKFNAGQGDDTYDDIIKEATALILKRTPPSKPTLSCCR